VNVSCRASQFDLQRTILAGLPFRDYDGCTRPLQRLLHRPGAARE
jgi:hypothetical protein